ncbi:hypothetical protein RchiOBHm_Chr3g0483271 [Rosa chinensis]|uniref:Uncharacterized protein n=1 Tax=Rosa chinensis TaxID=74649 RepID=A0A2P6REE0_ROSCH|nr:hypothetical protein RchiOBHm_Chr3g0483271 [Rosa chinensis]
MSLRPIFWIRFDPRKDPNQFGLKKLWDPPRAKQITNCKIQIKLHVGTTFCMLQITIELFFLLK